MAVMNRSAVVGVFKTREQAHQAVEGLDRAGFSNDQVTMVMHHDSKAVEITDLDAAKAAQVTGENKGGEGAAIGAVAGGLGAGAVALAMGTIPGVGPILSLGTAAAAGIFGAMFGIGAVAGAATGGIVGALVGMDIPEEEARNYEAELKAGRVLVGVKATHRLDEAASILEQCGGFLGLTAIAEEPPMVEPM
jgi:hypothetical protein